MKAGEIEYVVRETEHIDTSEGIDPEHWKTVPAWEITRVTSGMGWHIGRWTEKVAADAVAATLNGLTEYEAAP